MIRSAYQQLALVDTSAVVALHDPNDQFHVAARHFFSVESGLAWGAVNVTTHECYTHVRYRASFEAAMEHYDFMRCPMIRLLEFVPDDERASESLLRRYAEHPISYHDALCAAVMLRLGIYRIFTFDHHFSIFGFEVLPGSLA